MTAALAWTELKLLTREPLTLLVGLLFPLVLLALLGTSFGNDPDPDFGGVGGTDFYVPVYAAATIAVVGLLGLPTHLATYRQGGVLRRLRAAGVSPGQVLASQGAVMAVLGTVGIVLMVGVGLAGYDLSGPASVAGVIAGFAAGMVAFAGIGLLLGALLPTPRAAQGVGLLLFFGLFFIAGGGPPPALLPDAVNQFVAVTPMGPLVTAASDPWHGEGTAVAAVVTLLAIGVLATWLAARRLRRT